MIDKQFRIWVILHTMLHLIAIRPAYLLPSNIEQHPINIMGKIVEEEWIKLQHQCTLNNASIKVVYSDLFSTDKKLSNAIGYATGIKNLGYDPADKNMTGSKIFLSSISNSEKNIKGNRIWWGDADADNPDITININPNVLWATKCSYYEYGIQVRPMILHELLHGIGISSSFRSNGTAGRRQWLGDTKRYLTLFDTKIVNNKGEKIVNDELITSCLLGNCTVDVNQDLYINNLLLHKGSPSHHAINKGIMMESITNVINKCRVLSEPDYDLLAGFGIVCNNLPKKIYVNWHFIIITGALLTLLLMAAFKYYHQYVMNGILKIFGCRHWFRSIWRSRYSIDTSRIQNQITI